jgi:Tol biopolymer transport system component
MRQKNNKLIQQHVLLSLVALMMFLMGISPLQAQEDLDTTLARAAARGFLTALTRPELTDVQNFYLLEGVDIDTALAELGGTPITGFEVRQADWLDGGTFQTEAVLRPSNRTILVYTGRYDSRWKVDDIKLVSLASTQQPRPAQVNTTGPVTTTPVSQTHDFPAIDNGLTGLIAFQIHSGNDIYVINANGTGLRKVTQGIDPQLSSDGKQITFTRWEPYYTLYTINVDGTGEHAWASGWRQMKSPSWSPDGTRIVFSYQNGGRLDEEFVKFNPEEKMRKGQNIPETPGRVYDFEYDRVTGFISYKIPPDAYWHLQQIDLTTGQYIETATGSPYSYGSNFHPTDPAKIIFRGDKGLGLYDVNEKITRRISDDVGDKAAVISPDGTRIALSFRQAGHWEIHTMNIDGTGRQQLTSTPASVIANRQLEQQEVYVNEEGYRTIRTTQGAGQPNASWQWNHAAPAWSPDGSKLLFVTDRSGKWEIWIMNADGSDQQPMFTNGALDNVLLQYDGVDERMISWRNVE